jgi:alpha-mannosidase
MDFICSATTAKDIFRSQSRGLDTPLPNEIHLFNLRTISNSDFTEKPSNSALLILHRQSQSDCGTTMPETEHENISTTADLLPHFSDNEIKVKNLQRTTLTGNSKLSDLTKSFKDLKNWMFQPMRLATFKLNFFD